MILDTHILVWLHAGLTEQFTPGALALIESHDLAASPPSMLELDYLHEVGRIDGGADVVIPSLQETVGLRVLDVGAQRLFTAARDLGWTRDPFDRLIAAHSIATGQPMLTRDRLLLEHVPTAVWPSDA